MNEPNYKEANYESSLRNYELCEKLIAPHLKDVSSSMRQNAQVIMDGLEKMKLLTRKELEKIGESIQQTMLEGNK